MHNGLWNKPRQKVPKQPDREAEIRPVVPVLEHVEHVALDVDRAVEIPLPEALHRNLAPAAKLGAVLLAVEVEVRLDGLAGQLGLVRLARRHARRKGPVGDEDGEEGEEREEQPCLEAAVQLTREVPWHDEQGGDEEDVTEGVAAGTVGGEGRVLDGGVLAVASIESSEAFSSRKKRELALWRGLGILAGSSNKLTDVVRTPQSLGVCCGRGAGGVSTNSKDSSEGALPPSDMMARAVRPDSWLNCRIGGYV